MIFTCNIVAQKYGILTYTNLKGVLNYLVLGGNMLMKYYINT